MNKIHPTVIIGKDVILGDGNEILPYTIIEGPVTIGNNNVIGPHVIIGCQQRILNIRIVFMKILG